MRLFLSDGTLLMDSCWETYRLSNWTMESDRLIRWQEDTAELHAEVLSLDESALTLQLRLRSGTEEQRFVPASVPYVCPDMPR